MSRNRAFGSDGPYVSRGHTVPPPDFSTRTPAPKRSRSRRYWLVVMAAVLVLMLVTALVVIRTLVAPGRGARTPAGAVQQFLAAVARADTARALELQQLAPTQRMLLTDAVVGRSQAVAPIRDIEVADPALGSNMVPASFMVGSERVAGQWRVERQRDRTWKVLRGTSAVHVTFPANIPIWINGVQLNVHDVDLLPGRYQITTGLSYLAYQDDSFLVADPASTTTQLAPIPLLTSTGKSAFVAATRAALAHCLDQRQLSPPHCPQNVRSGEGMRFNPDTIRWQLINDPFTDPEPSLSINDESRAEWTVPLKLTLSVWVTRGSAGNQIEQSIELSPIASATMLADPIEVDFTK